MAPAVAIAAVWVAVALPVLARGGYTDLSRSIFVVLTGLALWSLLRGRTEDDHSIPAHPALIALLGFAAVAALSAAWTVGEAAEALRWSLVVAAYAGVVACGVLLGQRRRGVNAIAAVVCSLAALSGLVGLVAVALQVTPYAERIGGSWQPGGTLEYAPALALLQVSALPALLTAMCRGSRRLAVAAAVGAGIAGAQIGLSDSVVEQALGVGVLVAALAAAPRLLDRDRLSVALAASVVVVAGMATHAAVGGYARPIVNPGDGERLLAVVAAVLVPAAAWAVLAEGIVVRSSALSAGTRRSAGVGAAVVLVAGVVAGLVLADEAGRFKVRGVPGESGGGGGRLDVWEDTIDVALDRPLVGSGSEAFLPASLDEQGVVAVRFAHNLPLEAWAELGVAGLALALLLYGSGAIAIWRARQVEAGWLLGPAVAAFLIANLADWSWHLAGSGAVWALCLGGLVGAVSGPSPDPMVRSTGPTSR